MYWAQMLVTGCSTGNIPRTFWESIRPFRVAMQVGAVISVILVVFAAGLLWNHGLAVRLLTKVSFVGVLLLAIFNGAVMLVVQRVALRRFESFLKDQKWLICHRCGYLLVGQGAESRCPECAGQFAHPDLRDYWRDWLGAHGRGLFFRVTD